MGARIVTTLDKKALDVFYVDRVDHLTEEEHDEVWKKVEKNLRKVLGGEIEVDELIERGREIIPPTEERFQSILRKSCLTTSLPIRRP